MAAGKVQQLLSDFVLPITWGPGDTRVRTPKGPFYRSTGWAGQSLPRFVGDQDDRGPGRRQGGPNHGGETDGCIGKHSWA